MGLGCQREEGEKRHVAWAVGLRSWAGCFAGPLQHGFTSGGGSGPHPRSREAAAVACWAKQRKERGAMGRLGLPAGKRGNE